MIEIFKTNVTRQNQAALLVNLIQRTFIGYSATFDLEDCDRVLCVKSAGCEICAKSIIQFIEDFGYHAEILQDEIQILYPFSINVSRY